MLVVVKREQLDDTMISTQREECIFYSGGVPVCCDVIQSAGHVHLSVSSPNNQRSYSVSIIFLSSILLLVELTLC